MKKLNLILAILAALVSLLSVLQWRSAAEIRKQNQSLRQNENSFEDSAIAASATAIGGEEERRFQEQHLLLLRLRNQVRQLRDQLKEASTGHAANGGMPNSALTNSGAEPLAPENFIAKSVLSNVGLDTPEAAAQTFYWCLREGNVEHLIQCVTPEFGFQGWRLITDLARLSPQDRPEFIRTARIELQTRFKNFRDFQIAGREDISPEVCQLRLKSSTSRGTSIMTLRRIGGLWRVDSTY